MEKKLISTKEFRTVYAGGIGTTKFYDLVRQGTVPIVKIGRRSFVSVEVAESFIKSLENVKQGVAHVR